MALLLDWTEVGAEIVIIFQRVIVVSCNILGVDAYTYLIDLLQRLADHPIRGIPTATPPLVLSYLNCFVETISSPDSKDGNVSSMT